MVVLARGGFVLSHSPASLSGTFLVSQTSAWSLVILFYLLKQTFHRRLVPFIPYSFINKNVQEEEEEEEEQEEERKEEDK